MAKARRSGQTSASRTLGISVPRSTETQPGETGRYIVVYREGFGKDNKAIRASLSNLAGISSVAFSSDYADSAVTAEGVAGNDMTYFSSLGIGVMNGDAGMFNKVIAACADENSGILAIEPEYMAYTSSTPGLEYFRGYKDAVNQMYAQMISGAAEADLNADAAAVFQDSAQFTWGLQATRVHTSKFTGLGVNVAVLDTGMDLTHPDFVGRPIVGKSFITGEPVQDGNRHGTHCIGTSCGPKIPQGGIRRYGIAHQASIFAGKVLSNQGSGGTAGIIAGIEWAIQSGCKVISMSLSVEVDQQLTQFSVACQRALNAGSLVVAAAGNNARRNITPPNFAFVNSPANSDAAFAVASIDNSSKIASSSARSSTKTGVGGKVDIAAPGVNVFSSVPISFGKHALLSGTSMAAPHVAGIAALWSQATGAIGPALWQKLSQSTFGLPGLLQVDVGSGLVQAPQ